MQIPQHHLAQVQKTGISPTKTRGKGEADIADQVQNEELWRDRQPKQGKFIKEKEHI